MIMRTLAAILVLVWAASCLCSCQKSVDPSIPPLEGLGTIVVDAEPETVTPGWRLVGPNELDHVGQGDVTIVNLVDGTYTLTWDAYLDWTPPTPNPHSVELTADETVTIQGTYVPPTEPTGAVVITVLPVALAAEWTLSGPNAYELAGAGNAPAFEVPVGSYSITWTDYDGWITPTPNPTTVEVVADQTTVVSATYDADPVLPFPDTRNQLLANFRTVYENMDLEAYTQMLHPEFAMLLQAGTTAMYPSLGTELDLAEEIRIHSRMFSGEIVVDPDGALVPAVHGISLLVFEQQGTWSTSLPTDPIPDTEKALLDIIVLFNRGQSYSTLKVQGQIEFYVANRDSLHGEVTRPYFQLRGQRDLTLDYGKSEETNSLGAVKALFR